MPGTALGHHVPAACHWRLEMKKTFALTTVIFMCVVYGAEASSLTFSDTAVNAAGIRTIGDQFRAAIGGGVAAGANGSFGGVRREINWDGVPDALSAPNLMPPDFFNVNSPRGAVFSTPGSGFEVSANAGI